MPTVLALALGGVVSALYYVRSCALPPPVVKGRLHEDELAYLLEGKRGVLCAYTGEKAAWKGCLVQLLKDEPKDEEGGPDLAAAQLLSKVGVPRWLMEARCLQRQYLATPQLVAVPEADLRALDVDIFCKRPSAVRKTKLRRVPHVDFPGRALVLRTPDLLQAPPLDKTSSTPALPTVAIELPLGCGFCEVADLPSRTVMKDVLSADDPAGAAKQAPADSVQLFKGDRGLVEQALRDMLPRGIRIYVDGRPVYPAEIRPGGNNAEEGSVLNTVLAGCSLNTGEQVLEVLSAILNAPGRRLLEDILRLQCFAAGEAEKMADRLLAELKASSDDAMAELSASDTFRAAAKRAASGGIDWKSVRANEREAKRLMAAGSWGPQEIAAAKEWLTLFLLGRAAMDARLLVTVVSQGAAGRQSQLRSARFRPLSELQPAAASGAAAEAAEVPWVCATVTGLEPRSPSTIPEMHTELEELEQRYRALLAEREKA